MSQENVETVRAIYEEWGKGNFQVGLDFYDSHVLYMPPKDHPVAGLYLGLDRFREFSREWLKTWKHLTAVGEEFIEAENSVVAVTRWQGIGQESRFPFEHRDLLVWTFRGSTIIRVEQFQDRAEALEAVGLRE